MKKTVSLLISLLFFLTPAVFSDTPQFINFYYDIHSAGATLSDTQCQTIFNEPLRYNIIHDKPIYERNTHYTFSNYQRDNVTAINNSTFLFNGKKDVVMLMDGKSWHGQEFITFVLNTDFHEIRGVFKIPGFCQGRLIGLDTSVNAWPPKVILATPK